MHGIHPHWGLQLTYHTPIGMDRQPGIIPRAVADVFAYIREQTVEKREFLLRVSYMEIYNESIRDLLSSDSGEPRIMEDKRVFTGDGVIKQSDPYSLPPPLPPTP